MVTPSVARIVINGVPDVQIELKLRSQVGVCGEEKTVEPGGKPSEQGEKRQQTQLTWDAEYGNRTRVTEVHGRRAGIHCVNHAPRKEKKKNKCWLLEGQEQWKLRGMF